MEEKQKHKGRVFLLVGVIIAVFVVFRAAADEISDCGCRKSIGRWHREIYTSTQSIDAARGEMLDRYGRRLQSIRSAMM